MTISNFQDDFVEEMKELFSERKYKKANSENEERVALTFYKQALPIVTRIEDEDEPELSLAPYCIARLNEGDSGTVNKGDKVSLFLIFCIYDDDMNNQGHKDVLEIIERIKNRFMTNPLLKKQYVYDEEEGINWALPEDDTYPYYFGGLSITFEIPAVRKEDRFS